MLLRGGHGFGIGYISPNGLAFSYDLNPKIKTYTGGYIDTSPVYDPIMATRMGLNDGIWLPEVTISWDGTYGSGTIVGGVPYWWGGNLNRTNHSMVSVYWNSDLVRGITGDAIIYSVSWDLSFVGGGGWEGQLIIPLRGPQAFNGYVTDTYKLKGGGQLGVSVNRGTSYYIGPANEVNVYSMRNIGYSLDGNFKIVGASISASFDAQGNMTWLGYSVGAGPGIGGSINVNHTNRFRRLWSLR